MAGNSNSQYGWIEFTPVCGIPWKCSNPFTLKQLILEELLYPCSRHIGEGTGDLLSKAGMTFLRHTLSGSLKVTLGIYLLPEGNKVTSGCSEGTVLANKPAQKDLWPGGPRLKLVLFQETNMTSLKEVRLTLWERSQWYFLFRSQDDNKDTKKLTQRVTPRVVMNL